METIEVSKDTYKLVEKQLKKYLSKENKGNVVITEVLLKAHYKRII